VVFVVPVVHEAIDVQDVEEGARSNGQLKEKNDSRFRDADASRLRKNASLKKCWVKF